MVLKNVTTLALAATFLVGIAPMASAQGFTPVSEFSDVGPNHWAYNAIKAMVEKYQIMEGFPDNTFRGERTVNRYEMAALLAKVMSRVEEMIASATGEVPPPPRLQPNVSSDDLRVLARLQQEFRDELAVLKGRFDTFDSRLGALERRLRLGGSLQFLYRTYMAQPGTQQNIQEFDNLRVQTNLTLASELAPNMAFRGAYSIFNNGVQNFQNGHQAVDGGLGSLTGADTPTPLYVRQSYFSWTPGALGVYAGILTFRDSSLKIGSVLPSAFRSAAIWPQSQSGFGFVGTPPVEPTATGLKLVSYGPGLADTPQGRVAWNPGINVAEDLLDPNSVDPINTGSAPSVVFDASLGPVDLGFGYNHGTPGASTVGALGNLPDAFPVIAGPVGSGYSLLRLGADLGPARLGIYGRADNTALGRLTDAAPTGKGWGASLDLGSEALGLQLGWAEMNRTFSTTGLPYFNEGSVALVTNNLFGSLEFGAATKFGNAGGLAPTANPTLPMIGYNWTSTGGYVRFPGFSVFPSITLAAQQSGADLLSSSYGSGFTAIVGFQPNPALPVIAIQYDQGKFYGTEGGPTGRNSLFGGDAQTHDQLIVGTSLTF
jgi:hypothetical protein